MKEEGITRWDDRANHFFALVVESGTHPIGVGANTWVRPYLIRREVKITTRCHETIIFFLSFFNAFVSI